MGCCTFDGLFGLVNPADECREHVRDVCDHVEHHVDAGVSRPVSEADSRAPVKVQSRARASS